MSNGSVQSFGVVEPTLLPLVVGEVPGLFIQASATWCFAITVVVG